MVFCSHSFNYMVFALFRVVEKVTSKLYYDYDVLIISRRHSNGNDFVRG